MKPHSHRWQFAWHSGTGKKTTICFRCTIDGCRESQERRVKPAEARFLGRDQSKIHVVFHDFVRRFIKKDEKFRWTGYDLILRVERWAKRWPNDVRIVGCDDSVFSGSDLVLIEHQDKREYMGTSVVYIPQNGVLIEPAQFFLYPSAGKHLINMLRDIRRASVERKNKERADQIKGWAVVSKWRP